MVTELHFEERGDARAPVLLLLHPFPLHGAALRPQLAGLAGKAWRVVVPDQRGFGKTPLPPSRAGADGAEKTTMDDLADDAIALLDRLGVERAVVGGVSMGGYAVMALLRRAPDRVRAVVLADTQAAADDEAARAKRDENAAAVLENGMVALEGAMLPKLVAPEAPRGVKDEVRRMLLAADPRAVAAALRGMKERPDSSATLAAWKGPALVIVGDQDEITPPAKADAMAALMPHVKVTLVGGGGHLSNLDSADAFNAAVERFLAGL